MVRGRAFGERLGRLAFAGTVGLALTIILAPLVLVVWLSFFTNEILSLPPEGYSLRWYGALVGQRQFVSGFQLSAVVALAATAAGLLVTLPAAFALSRGDLPGREAILHGLMSPLIVPALVVGAGLYLALIEFEVETDLPVSGTVFGF